MSAPSTYPVWATDGTNNVAASAGQQASGWTFEQDAVSSYFNAWMNLVYLWIVYLAGNVAGAWRWHFPNVLATAGGSYTLLTTADGFVGGASGSTVSIPVVVPVGLKITNIGVEVKGAGGTNLVYFSRTHLGVTSILVGPNNPTSTMAVVNTTSAAKYTAALTTPEVVVDGDTFLLTITLANGDKLSGVGVLAVPQ